VSRSTDGNGWWNDQYFNVRHWLLSLHNIAAHYGNASVGTPNAVAFSLRNELRNNNKTREQQIPQWYRYVALGVEALHRANNLSLVFVSGLSYDCDLAFLQDEHEHNRWDELYEALSATLLFEAHIYEWSGYGNFTPTCKGALTGFDNAIGYPYHQHRPLVLTEMGLVTSAYPHNANEAAYWSCVTQFIQQRQLGFGVWVLGGSYLYRNGIDTRDPFGNLDAEFTKYQNSAFLVALQDMIVNFTQRTSLLPGATVL
jgi:hypothetical protein